MSTSHVQPVDDLLDQSCFWITRLSSDCVTESDLQEFSLWLAQSHAHKKAYDDTLEVWQNLEVVKHLPFEDTPPRQSTPVNRSSFIRNYRWKLPVALAASILMAMLVYPLFWYETVEPQFYSTAIGEQKTIQLTDGSSITLNTNTRLKVLLTPNLRSINLQSGEAYFEVAKEPERPFVVNNCFSKVRAVGTAFNINCSDTKGVVTVSEGIVEVSSSLPSPSQRTATFVKQNESVNVDNTYGFSKPVEVDSQQIINWRHGQFIFENTPLNKVLQQANRYSTTKIHLGSPKLAQLRVSGRFEMTDTQTLIAALQHSLSLDVIIQGDKSIVLNHSDL